MRVNRRLNRSSFVKPLRKGETWKTKPTHSDSLLECISTRPSAEQAKQMSSTFGFDDFAFFSTLIGDVTFEWPHKLLTSCFALAVVFWYSFGHTCHYQSIIQTRFHWTSLGLTLGDRTILVTSLECRLDFTVCAPVSVNLPWVVDLTRIQ